MLEMECNRDEALRAKEISERKFSAKDVAGAKKFALKAQNLFPSLEGINQMIATLDVYLAAEVKINGENDWYAILCVNASADEETVKKQYRKLALQLHPDKNKSIGAEGAFKLISEAWSVLSDKSRKTVYDQKINNGLQKRTQSNRDHSVSSAANGFYNFTNNTSSKRARKSSTSAAQSVASSFHSSKLDTFWTSCNRCRMQYEYLRVYLNHNLLCPNCHQAFLATEIGVPTNGHNSNVSWSAKQHQQNLNHNSTMKNAYVPGNNASAVPGMGHTSFQHGGKVDSYNNLNFQWGPYSKTTGTASTTDSTVEAANMIHQTFEKLRRKHEAQAAAGREEDVQSKNYVSRSAAGNSNAGVSCNAYDRERHTSKIERSVRRRRNSGGDAGFVQVGDTTEQQATGSGTTGAADVERANVVLGDYGKARLTSRQNNLSKFSQIDIRSLLMAKTKAAVLNKLEEWNSAAAARLIEKEKLKQNQKQKEHESAKVAAADNGDAVNQRFDNAKFVKKQLPGPKATPLNNGVDAVRAVSRSVTIDVPDPDFHDFDKDRLERSFEGDNIWATYDSEDGMPRLYAMVQKVISLKPFKIRMSFLNSKSNSELGPLNWVSSGFTKTCGNFRVGRYEVTDTVNIFSHRVRWEKGPRGVIKILPRKGDTWALYKNWSPNWNEHTPDEVIYKYEMVEVLEDYNEEQGVSVTPLVKVAGFKAVFHRHMDPKEVKRIPREEMFRFSHQVPSYLLTGEEAHNAPKGCHQLDPAATPVELLQVITEVKEDVVIQNSDKQPGS